MRANVPTTTLDRVTVQQIDIGTVNAGPLGVGRLVLDDMHVDLSTGTAHFTNLRVTVGLALSLDWKVEVGIPWIGSWSWADTIDLGSTQITIGLGDPVLPGLESFTLDLARLSLEDLRAIVRPLRNLRLGPLVAERIRAHDAVIPRADVQILGLGLGRMALEGLAIPDAAVAGTEIGRIAGSAFPVGTVTIPELTLPAGSVADITSQDIDAGGTATPVTFTADSGVLSISLRVVPSARMQADEIRLGNVRSSARIGRVELQNVVLPYEVLDLTLSDIGINTIDVPKLEVG
jgi:hypothetical protein